MANRRKFLAGLGALASGSAAAIGTGAFDTVEAERTVSVNVAGDSNALLGLDATTGTHSGFASQNGDGEVEVSIDGSASDITGSGINANGVTRIFDIFQIRNQGTEPAVVYVPPSSVTIGGTSVLNGSPDDYVDPQASNRPNGDFSKSPPAQYEDEVSLTGVYNDPFLENVDTLFGDGSDGDGLEEFLIDTGQSISFGLYLEDDGDGTFSDVSMEIVADTTVVTDSILTENGL